MKIVILSSWFSERMGYIENCLPKALALLGHEVHVVSSTAQVYFNSPDYKDVYEPFLGKNIVEVGEKMIDGYTLHRIPFVNLKNKILLQKLGKKLAEIRPDVVQVFDAFSVTTLQAAWYQPIYRYKLFTANHTVASVFPLFQKGQGTLLHKIFFYFTRTMPGTMVSWITCMSFPATIDALDIAVKYYGVPLRKAKLASLGVDTDFFAPPAPSELEYRFIRRRELGVADDTLLCIYTGRFTASKNPLCLAKAIEKLNMQGEKITALFMGDGAQLSEIKSCKGCIVHEFVPYHRLPQYYHLADIGVWPCQESTSMIDASACGLPIIISNRVQALERVEGNGLTYIENDVDDMMQVLLKMKDEKLREKLSEHGIKKITDLYSWNKIAVERIHDYKKFVKN